MNFRAMTNWQNSEAGDGNNCEESEERHYRKLSDFKWLYRIQLVEMAMYLALTATAKSRKTAGVQAEAGDGPRQQALGGHHRVTL